MNSAGGTEQLMMMLFQGLTVSGTTTTVTNSTQVNIQNAFVFEGAKQMTTKQL